MPGMTGPRGHADDLEMPDGQCVSQASRCSDHHEVARGDGRRLVCQGREQHRVAHAVAVGIEPELACRLVVDDPVVRIQRRIADHEGAGREQTGGEAGEDIVIERDPVCAGAKSGAVSTLSSFSG
jgi:hypothetical protein